MYFLVCLSISSFLSIESGKEVLNMDLYQSGVSYSCQMANPLDPYASYLSDYVGVSKFLVKLFILFFRRTLFSNTCSFCYGLYTSTG